MAGEAFRVIPDVCQHLRASCCSASTAAGSRPRPGLAGFSTSLTKRDTGAARRRATRVICLTHSADVGLLIGVLGVGRVLGDEGVEDELGGGVSIGARAIGLGVQFPMSLPRSVAAADKDPDGLIDD